MQAFTSDSEFSSSSAGSEVQLGVGDGAPVSIGRNTNVQDGALIQSIKLFPKLKTLPSTIGQNVTIGHGAVLNGVDIEDGAFIGIGAILQEGTKARTLLSQTSPETCSSTWF